MELLFALVAFLVFFACMTVGLLFKGRPLKGSCGGVATLMGNDECEICGGDPNACEKENAAAATNASDLAYDATATRN